MCEDHFVEPDTIYHSWEAIAEIIKFTRDPPFDDILCLVGLPINHRGVIYNCGAFIIAGRIILLKPKLVMCDDTVYRESRFFTSWKGGNTLMDYPLPPDIAKLCHQKTVPFGNALLRSDDGFLIGAEYCEELWCSIPSSTHLFLQGAHIVLNISGSIFYQRKLDKRMDLILSATVKTGGAYVYANFRGCDGSRCYLDGSSMIAMNGQFYALGK
mmetsp:Transcript_21663/g.3566  ORF Transcript_21663/g.3566 Transcript_21663/m.3566 type:complete len:213 (-) Transcript_21663:1328-1966(-)